MPSSTRRDAIYEIPLCHNRRVMTMVAEQADCPPTPRCDEAALIEIVERAMHSSASEWLFLRELRVGTDNGTAVRSAWTPSL
jgi:hypothetical protein